MATVRIYNLASENTNPQTGQYLAIDGSTTTQKINFSNLKKGVIGDSSMNTTATTVTGAIAEHSGKLATQTTNISQLQSDVAALETLTGSLFTTRTFSASYDLQTGGYANITAQDFNFSIPTGYTPISFTRIATGNGDIAIRSFNVGATGGTNMLNLRATPDTYIAAGQTAQITVLFAKTSVIG